MNYAEANRQTEILHMLSDEIFTLCKGLCLEQRAPARDADASDDYMKETKDRILKLRRVREELEVIFTGVLL